MTQAIYQEYFTIEELKKEKLRQKKKLAYQ